MKLLKKEAMLAASPLTYIFIAFSAITMIPGYPILVGSFFVTLGIFYSFQFSREQNDIVYSCLLPISKKSVVFAKYLFVCLAELVSFLFMGVFTLLRMTVFAQSTVYTENPMMSANIAYLGYVLIIFGLFNMIFLAKFFKTAYHIGKPFVLYAAASFLTVAVAETLHHIPMLSDLGDILANFSQVCVFVAGILIFVFGTVWSYKLSVKRFERIDL